MMTPQNLIFASSSLFVLLHFFPTCLANLCTPSACGVIRNISAPFRLNHDPPHCGDSRFELACENDVASLSLNSHKYFVKQINYNNYTIRLVDASININDTCSFPNSSAYFYNFTNPYQVYPYSSLSDSPPYDDVAWPINLMSCTKPLKNSSLFVDFSRCNPSHTRFSYIKVGHLNASEVPEKCGIDVIVMTSWGFKDPDNVSLQEIHQSLLYGFELARGSYRSLDLYLWPHILILLSVSIASKKYSKSHNSTEATAASRNAAAPKVNNNDYMML